MKLISFLGKERGPSFEQLWILFTYMDALCQVWLKLAQWFWSRRFLNFVNVFPLFRKYLPLKKGEANHLNKVEFPSPKDVLCQVWLKEAQWFRRRRWKCEKFTTTTTTDNGQILIRKAHSRFSSGELKHSGSNGICKY